MKYTCRNCGQESNNRANLKCRKCDPVIAEKCGEAVIFSSQTIYLQTDWADGGSLSASVCANEPGTSDSSCGAD